MTLNFWVKPTRDGRPLKKYKCDSHPQSDDPNPTKGIDAPGSIPIKAAHMCSHGRER
jgi:hypothetical protein